MNPLINDITGCAQNVQAGIIDVGYHSFVWFFKIYLIFFCFKLNSLSLDTYAMAGMALQCVKNAGFHVHSVAELHTALNKIKQKLLVSRRTDGHIGNEFSTGLAVQVRIIFLCILLSSAYPCMKTVNTPSAFSF